MVERCFQYHKNLGVEPSISKQIQNMDEIPETFRAQSS